MRAMMRDWRSAWWESQRLLVDVICSGVTACLVGKGDEMPLSEEEQRILHEMEKKLYEHDRGFIGRDRGPRSLALRSLRGSIALFIAGFVILVLSFRSSLLLATFGFLVMLLSTVMFERSLRQTKGDLSGKHALGEDLSTLANRLRSRFFQQH